MLLKIISAVVLVSSTSLANTQAFRGRVYDAMDILATKEFGRFREAVSILAVARDLTDNNEAQKEVESAIKILGQRSGENNQLSSAELTDKVDVSLKTALRRDRIKLTESQAMGVDALEALLLSYLFGDHSSQLKLVTNNIGKADALPLLLTFVVDSRAAKYDPDVKELISKKNSQEEVSDKSIGFRLPDEVLVPPDDFANKNDFVQNLKEAIKDISTPEIPIKFKVQQTKTGEIIIRTEVMGLDAINFIETWIRNPLVLANGNRYVFATANGVEALSTAIKSQYLGANNSIEKLVHGFATKVLDPAEDVLRKKLLAEQWSPIGVGTVKEQLTQETNITIEHMKKNLEHTLEKLKGTYSTPEEIAAVKEKTDGYIASAQAKLKAGLEKINQAMADLEKSDAFQKASDVQKAEMRVAAAENAGGVKVWRWQTCLKYVSAVIATYYVYEWTAQYQRAKTQKEKDLISDKYGVKLANTMLYFVPALGEAAIAIDILGGWAVNFVFKQAGMSVRVPNVEQIMHWGVEKTADVILAMKGIYRFDVTLNEMKNSLGLSEFKDGSGQWWEGNIIKKENEALHDSSLLTLEDKKKFVNNEFKSVAGKYLLLFYNMNVEFSREEKRLMQFHEQLLAQWQSPNTGFMKTSFALIH